MEAGLTAWQGAAESRCVPSTATQPIRFIPPLHFELLAQHGAARRGRLHTAHGAIETPAFMPLGTTATVKALTFDMVRATGTQIVLGNTYHLMLRPGADRIARLGGLRRFMGW